MIFHREDPINYLTDIIKGWIKDAPGRKFVAEELDQNQI